MLPTTTDTTSHTHAAVAGAPRVLLRLEGALVLFGAFALFGHLGGSWLWFAALFLVPDVSLLGYLAGPRFGAVVYNTGHSYVGPALLAALSFVLSAPVLLLGATIWAAHVGFDRMLGYGLKYGTRFSYTHLGVVGRRARALSGGDAAAPVRT
jgi:hypothetical protein